MTFWRYFSIWKTASGLYTEEPVSHHRPTSCTPVLTLSFPFLSHRYPPLPTSFPNPNVNFAHKSYNEYCTYWSIFRTWCYDVIIKRIPLQIQDGGRMAANSRVIRVDPTTLCQESRSKWWKWFLSHKLVCFLAEWKLNKTPCFSSNELWE